jgi:hypothetical protein
VLSGFTPDARGLTAQVIEGTLRPGRTGTTAGFSLVLATAGHALTATSPSPGTLQVDHRRIDFARLPAAVHGLPPAR